jgi:hypothetical protein
MKRWFGIGAALLIAAPVAMAALRMPAGGETREDCCRCCADCACDVCLCDAAGCACADGGPCACSADCCRGGACCGNGVCTAMSN